MGLKNRKGHRMNYHETLFHRYSKDTRPAHPSEVQKALPVTDLKDCRECTFFYEKCKLSQHPFNCYNYRRK
jgi:hypothetical protein